ncbi:MAG TPA: type II secretion system F family protein [Isosphaeraceae bacterium]|nr:type II secretion system F family protein [Isosphaeraceae bacterium]
MSPAILTLLTFLAVGLAVVGVYSILTDFFLRDRSRVSRRVDDEFRKSQRERVKKSPLFKNLGQLAAEAMTGEERPSLRKRLEAMIEQSGMDLTVPRLMGMSTILGLMIGAVGWLLSQNIALGGGAAAVAFSLPILYVNLKRRARQEKLRTQLPDAFDLMSRVIRAGQTMSQALLAVSDEFPPPIAAEFSYCYEQQNLGLAPEITLRDLARRNGMLEIKIFVLAMLVQQQTGGNLAELLDKLSTVVRDRFRIRGAIKTLTAEGRLQAVVLLILPLALFVMMLFSNPDYAQVLLDNPKLIMATLVCEGFGALWIRKIVNFDF